VPWGLKARVRALVLERAPRLALGWLDLDRAELGQVGEALAARALRRAGWRLAGRRVRTPQAEIDLVVHGPGVLVCVEVKTGRLPQAPGPAPPRWRPGGRLGGRTLARQGAAGRWLGARAGLAGGRVDLIEVEVWGRPSRFRLRHTPDLRAPLLNG
jgi:Uncharacterised protein family UPF0102